MNIININKILKNSYLDYSMSVIVARAIPDIRDGLKPVHRRILYSMYKLNLNYNNKFKKSARVVGEVLGKYHPHGDSSVYNAIVRMVQKWTLRYPLLLGQGNFGSIESDAAAAMRYTEIKLSKISKEISFKKIKYIVKMKSNFDNSLKEPIYLPIEFPNLLINGSYGIAVGMATNMVPHNLSEIIDTIGLYIKNPNIKKKEMFKYIKGPDFPTGGTIIYNDYKYLYKGKGKITLIAKYKINYKKKIIIIKEIPYQVSKLNILDQIKKNIKYNKIIGISKIIDKTDRKGINIYFYIKKKYNINICLNQLLKYSQLKIHININNLVLVKSKPKVLNFKKIIYYYIKHNHKLYKKDILYKYKLNKNKLLLLNSILKIIINIKDVLDLFKKSKSKKYLMKKLHEKYNLSNKIILKILKMRLYKLSNYEYLNLQKNKKLLLNKINKLKKILSSKKIRINNIYKKLLKIKNKYKDKRKTIININNLNINNYNKLIHNNKIIIIFFKTYIIKLIFNLKKILKNKIFNKNINKIIINNSNNKYLFCFTKKGIYFKININNLKYNNIYNIDKFIILNKKDKIISIVKNNNIKKYKYIYIITKYGYIKKKKIKTLIKYKKKKIFLNKKDYLLKCFFIKKKKNLFLINIINKKNKQNNLILKKYYIKYNINNILISNILYIKNFINIKLKYKYIIYITYNNILKILKITKIKNFIKKKEKIIYINYIYKQKNIIIINKDNNLFIYKLYNILFIKKKKYLKIKNKISKILLF
ncbi:MAG: DNA gyrase subunit A [Candidatus Shikimatogenerans sp. Tduv]|uniref:DNA gyrase subunit A n=1 Tax=Candidatus Shikimatogenerans sp. Tduv TaxID=3158567 RepID=A0AAU7QR72_9FLAO